MTFAIECQILEFAIKTLSIFLRSTAPCERHYFCWSQGRTCSPSPFFNVSSLTSRSPVLRVKGVSCFRRSHIYGTVIFHHKQNLASCLLMGFSSVMRIWTEWSIPPKPLEFQRLLTQKGSSIFVYICTNYVLCYWVTVEQSWGLRG